MKLARYIVITLAVSLIAVASVSASGVFYYDSATNEFVGDSNLKVQDPSTFNIFAKELVGLTASPLYLNGNQLTQLRFGKDSTANNLKFRVLNNASQTVLEVDNAGGINAPGLAGKDNIDTFGLGTFTSRSAQKDFTITNAQGNLALTPKSGANISINGTAIFAAVAPKWNSWNVTSAMQNGSGFLYSNDNTNGGWFGFGQVGGDNVFSWRVKSPTVTYGEILRLQENNGKGDLTVKGGLYGKDPASGLIVKLTPGTIKPEDFLQKGDLNNATFPFGGMFTTTMITTANPPGTFGGLGKTSYCLYGNPYFIDANYAYKDQSANHYNCGCPSDFPTISSVYFAPQSSTYLYVCVKKKN